jgi:hypothetical protein
VFTVLIYPVLFNQMLRAATAVLNKVVPKELLPILIISKISPSLLGCMFLESPSRHLPFTIDVPQLHIESNPPPKKRVIVTIVMQGRNLKKQHSLLTEATVLQSIQAKLISTHEINNEIIVFDGGAIDNPPIRPSDGVIWRCIPICEGNYAHICDEVGPHCGLTFQRVDNVLLFIRLPRSESLNILSKTGHYSISKALQGLEKLKKTSLVRSDQKRIFGDYGTKVMYTCAGVQVSRHSCMVLEAAPYIENLPRKHCIVLMRLMTMAERCFEKVVDSAVLSHVHNAKNAVPFK